MTDEHLALDPDSVIPDPDPILCDLCKKEIKQGERFIEISTLGPVITHEGGGYIRQPPRKSWSREEVYIHLRHVLMYMSEEDSGGKQPDPVE